MGAVRKLLKLINKESPFEGEANGLLFLIRSELLIIVPVYLIMGFYSVSKSFGYKPVLVFFAGVIVYSGIFVETYTRRSKRCLYYLIVSATIITGLLTMVFGWRVSYQNFIYVILLILWYDPTAGNSSKAYSSIFITISMCVISYLTPFGESLIRPGSIEHNVIIYTNIIVFALCLSVVAYFFCNQYIESERKLREYNRKLKGMSETDPLTMLMNRRCAKEELDETIKESEKEKYLFCIAIGDIDFFKKINDTYGHEAGDFILKSLAADFKTYMKDKGFVARWGGEEFLFVFKRSNGDEALGLLDHLRLKIKTKKYTFEGQDINITMTFGIEEYGNKGVEKVIAEADKKLYIGKQSGRDRVIF